MNVMSEGKIVKKSISLPQKLADEIKEYSSKQKRSFSSQIALWAEEKLSEINSNDKQSDS
jgi:metal-responsive CopG/Arc/MetJ family transcriptional regulator